MSADDLAAGRVRRAHRRPEARGRQPPAGDARRVVAAHLAGMALAAIVVLALTFAVLALVAWWWR